MKCYVFTLTGNVQGVGCRYYCSKVAKQMRLHGACTNMADGSVNVIIATDSENLAQNYANALRINKYHFTFYGHFSSITYYASDQNVTGQYLW